MTDSQKGTARSAVQVAIAQRRRVMLVVGDPLGRSLAWRAVDCVPDAIALGTDGRENVVVRTTDGAEKLLPLANVLLVESLESEARAGA